MGNKSGTSKDHRVGNNSAHMADSDDDAAPDEPVIGGGAKPGISLNIGGGKSSSFREESAEIAGGEVTLLIKNEEGKEVSSSVRSTLPAPDPHAAPAAPTPYLLLTTQFAVGFTVEAVKALCKKLFDLGEEKPITVCATPSALARWSRPPHIWSQCSACPNSQDLELLLDGTPMMDPMSLSDYGAIKPGETVAIDMKLK